MSSHILDVEVSPALLTIDGVREASTVLALEKFALLLVASHFPETGMLPKELLVVDFAPYEESNENLGSFHLNLEAFTTRLHGLTVGMPFSRVGFMQLTALTKTYLLVTGRVGSMSSEAVADYLEVLPTLARFMGTLMAIDAEDMV